MGCSIFEIVDVRTTKIEHTLNIYRMFMCYLTFHSTLPDSGLHYRLRSAS